MMLSKPILRYFVLLCALLTIGATRASIFSSKKEGGIFSSESRFGWHRNTNVEFTDAPKQIALLLPLTGKHAEAAKAIQDGFFASYYAAAQKPTVRVYDTSREKDVQRVYDLAIQEGADFVVGPLAKEDVQRLSTLSGSALRAPVLALNYQPGINPPPHFAQFTLAPESEAVQIAQRAALKGYRSACLIVPDNTWGKRTAAAFTQQWQQQGGQVVRTVYVNAHQDQAEAVRRLLGVDQSQDRANQIKNLIAEKVEFQPKRRQDMDVIVMAAPPEQARQLKPLFDFYYAEDLPVFATSSIYSGQPNPRRDRDINGVVFCDMPWLIDPQQGRNIREWLAKQEAQSEQYNRLFAMGVDAYQLTTQMKRLHDGGHFMGATGQLSWGEHNQIERKLIFAKIVNGAPVLAN